MVKLTELERELHQAQDAGALLDVGNRLVQHAKELEKGQDRLLHDLSMLRQSASMVMGALQNQIGRLREATRGE